MLYSDLILLRSSDAVPRPSKWPFLPLTKIRRLSLLKNLKRLLTKLRYNSNLILSWLQFFYFYYLFIYLIIFGCRIWMRAYSISLWELQLFKISFVWLWKLFIWYKIMEMSFCKWVELVFSYITRNTVRNIMDEYTKA